MAQDFFDEVKDHAKKQGLDHMGVSLIERHSVSFIWSQRINASIGGVSANRILQILATDRPTPAVGLLMTTPAVGPSLLRMLIPP